MPVISKVNPNFPLPGIDQSTKGFRDNFAITKTEIENLQSKTIQLVGAITSAATILDSGTAPVVITTTSAVYRQGFVNADLTAGVLTVVHNLGQQFVIVQISNNVNQVVMPDLVVLLNSTTVTVDVSSYGAISGTWNVVVRA
jgi:hypothetical protein